MDYFAEMAMTLLSRGYQPVPVSEKIPVISGWQSVLLDEPRVKGLQGQYPRHGVGIRTGQGDNVIVFVDIDVTDPVIAEIIDTSCVLEFGEGLLRVGKAPKRGRVYRTSSPFRKLQVWLISPTGEKHKIEILGKGQQFQGFGIHPGTGKEYEWVGDSLLDRNAWDLESIGLDDINHWLESLAAVLPKDWAVTRSQSNGVIGSDDEWLANHVAPMDGVSIKDAEKDLSVISSADFEYEDWLKVGMALHHQFSGSDEARELWDAWSRDNKHYGPTSESYIRSKWRSFHATNTGQNAITYRTLRKWSGDKLRENSSVATSELLAEIQSCTDPKVLQTSLLEKAARIDAANVFDEAELLEALQKRAKALGKASPTKANLRKAIDAMRADSQAQTAQHPVLADTVVQELGGRDNLLTHVAAFWRWSDEHQGVWTKIETGWVRNRISTELRKCTRNDFNGTAIGSVQSIMEADLTRAESLLMDHRGRQEINFRNGELRYENGSWVLDNHVREHYWMTQVPWEYDPGADCPRFLQFLDECFQGADDIAERKQLILEFMGYTLMSHCRLEKFLILTGSGANGKSVLLRVVEEMVGKDFRTAVQIAKLDNEYQIAHLHGKLLAVCSEIPEGAMLPDAVLKTLVSGETILGRRPYEPPFDFNNTATFWFATNHLPYARDFSGGLKRRAVLMDFPNTVPESMRDPHLTDKLVREMPGIILECLRAYQKVIDRGEMFTHCPSSETRLQDWYGEINKALGFLQDCCEPDPGGRIQAKDLYAAFNFWCADQGIKSVSMKNFIRQLGDIPVEKVRSMGKIHVLGWKFRREEEEDDF